MQQSGERSSVCNLIQYFHEIIFHYDSQDITSALILYINLRKSVDKVKQEMHLKRKYMSGRQKAVLSLLRNYFQYRKKRVRRGNVASIQLFVHSGVTQVSLRAALHFLLYINVNDLTDSLMSNKYGSAANFKLGGTNHVTLDPH